MIFERGGEMNACCGEAGNGVYAYVAPSNAMRTYYTSHGEPLYRLKPKTNAVIIDFTQTMLLDNLISYMKTRVLENKKVMQFYVVPKINKSNYQRYGSLIEEYVLKHYKGVDAWIVLHKGTGIPTGKQAVIRNLQAFEIELMR